MDWSMKLIEVVDHPLTELAFYPHLVISTPKYGVHIDLRGVESIYATVSRLMRGSFSLVSVRNNDFSMDPGNCGYAARRFPFLASIGIVTNRSGQKAIFHLESRLMADLIPLALFSSLEEAVDWSQRIWIDQHTHIGDRPIPRSLAKSCPLP